MRGDSTKRAPITRTLLGGTPFTLDITQTNPPKLMRKSTARRSRFEIWFGGRLRERPLSFQASVKRRLLARFRHADRPRECPVIGASQKGAGTIKVTRLTHLRRRRRSLVW
jgi:hypothetical protein